MGHESGETGHTYPMQASAIKKGGHVVIKGRPCKVVETSTSKTGKHGHAKVHFVALDIFNSRKYEDLSPSTHTMHCPNVNRVEYILVDINEDGFASLMDEASGSMKEDLKIPDNDVGQQIQADFDAGKELIVQVLSAMGEEQIMSAKDSK